MIKHVSFALIFVLLAVGFKSSVSATGVLDDPPPSVMVGQVRVDMKGPDYVVIGERKFLIDHFTQIYDQAGNKITLKLVPVPCNAVIWYKLVMDKDPIVVKLLIKELYPNSSIKISGHE